MSSKFVIPLLVVVAVAIGAVVWTFSDSGSSTDSHTDANPISKNGVAPNVDPTKQAPKPIDKVPLGGDDKGSGVTRDVVKSSESFDPSGVLTVVGKVTSAATKQPVADAEVEVLYPDGESIDSAFTEEDGTYRLAIEEGIPPVINIRAKGETFAAKVMTDVHVTKDGRDITANFELPAAFSIVGRIIAAKDGAPIEGAEVEIRSTSALFEDDWDSSEESTPNGEYKITDITDLPREGFDLFVTSSGHCPQVMKDLKVPDGQTELRVDFTLYETLTLKGVVVSAADNQPIEDASVYASSPDPDFEDDGTDEVTDENGAFSMELDSIPLDGMFVLATADAHAAVSIPAVPAPDRSGVIDLGRIALPAAPHLIGVVVDKATNQPIPGGEVSVYPFNAPQKDEGDFGVSETIDATGRFEMDLTSAPSDAAEILIEAKDCFPIRQRLNVPPGQAQIELRFEVERQIVLTGMVTRPGDQSPVAGARVRLITAADVTLEDELFSRTRPDGTYRIELPAGDVGRFAIVAEYGSKRFPIGKLTASEVGDYKIVRNFTMDVPKLEKKIGPQTPENMPKLPEGIRRPEIPGMPKKPVQNGGGGGR